MKKKDSKIKIAIITKINTGEHKKSSNKTFQTDNINNNSKNQMFSNFF